MALPKVHFVFFEYFFRAVIGEMAWKIRMKDDRKRLGSTMAEAYANLQLNNNYFAWLYDYKMKHPNTTLKTEYDLMNGQVAANTDEARLFCGELDWVEVAVPTLASAAGEGDSVDSGSDDDPRDIVSDNFKLLLPEVVDGGDTSQELDDGGEATTQVAMATREMKEARARELNITRAIWARVNADRSGDEDGSSTLLAYQKMCQAVRSDIQTSRAASTPAERKAASMSCRKSKTSLRHFTKGTRKSKKGSDEIKGWSVQGKLYMERMVRRIKSEDRNCGRTTSIRRKWEFMYKEISKITQAGCGSGGNGIEDDGDTFEMNEELMYGELIEAV